MGSLHSLCSRHPKSHASSCLRFKYMKRTFFIIALFIFFAQSVFAGEVPNNKFGIHLAQPNLEDLKKAADLVNAKGGKWGYVTLVMQENDRNQQKWQEVFDNLRELQLIPIIRVATKPEGASWRRPTKEEIDFWAQFLSSLNWVVKNKYVILFNETNHGSEWGGAVDPEGYAEIAKRFAEKLKEKSPDFFIMLAGFDASAPSASPAYEDEYFYLKRVVEKIGADDFNKLFSGLSSHSYPNPGFAGSPLGVGRGTVSTYRWEREILAEFGVKDLPVFITETGWDAKRISRQQIGSLFAISFESLWLQDDEVIAVTPFVLSYLTEPFANFSWVAPDNESYYPSYYAVQGMAKEAGSPQIVEKGEISFNLPKDIVMLSTYNFKINLKNTGQAIWDKSESYSLSIENADDSLSFLVGDLRKLKPNDEGVVDLSIKTIGLPGQGKVKIVLKKGERKMVESKEWVFNILPLPKLEFKIGFYPKLKAEAANIEVQVFDQKEQLVYKQKNVKVAKGKGVVEGVPNIVVGEKYRVVILRPYYLPRQTHVTFKKEINKASFTAMFPLDFDKDGAWTLQDLKTLVGNFSLMSLMLP